MFICEIYPKWRYAWVWKFQIDWNKGVTVGFYPDWENCWREIKLR